MMKGMNNESFEFQCITDLVVKLSKCMKWKTDNVEVSVKVE